MNDNDILLREAIRENLTLCRLSKGITQTDVGKIVGKTKTAVASWEQGISLPDITTLYKLSKFYEKEMEYFYTKQETKQ